MDTVGFIGLGNMGSGMAINLQNKGYLNVVYDVREEAARPFLEAGARLASSPAEVAELSDVICSSLPGPKEVEEVALGPQGILEGIKPNGVYVDLSTSRPTLIREIEPKFRQKGAHVLDAPVSGGKTGAASGNLALMVGGERDIYDQIKPILDAMGDKVFYAGEIGAGSVCKLAHNMITQGVMQAMAEGLTLGVKAGVEPKALWECIRRGGLGRMSMLHEIPAITIFKGKFEPPGFALSLLRKDMGLATELGREFDVPLPIASLSEQFLVQAMNRGWGDKDASIFFCLQEEMADVEVRAEGVDPIKAAKFITTHPDIE